MTGARTVVALALATVAATAVAFGATATLPERIRAVAATYYARAATLATVTNRYSIMDYYQRLIDDAANLSDRASRPSPVRMQIEQSEAQLDLSLAQQLLNNSFIPIQSIRGAGETFVRSSKDGTMEPVAVYVPQHYVPHSNAPLVVFLHGLHQPESDLIAPLFMQEIAEQNDTVVVAPYGRAYFDFVGSESDVYDAYDAALDAFPTPATRRYLAGFSMGAISVFKIALIRPDGWSALMSIAGALPNNEEYSVVYAMHNMRFYVVTGERDAVVPPINQLSTATFLRDAGLAVSFYSVPDGTHSLYALRSAVGRAWADMIRGTVRAPIGL